MRCQMEDVYEIEEILDERLTARGGTEYLIKWVGYEDEVDKTWEPEKEIRKAKLIIQAWNDKKERRAKGSSSSSSSASNNSQGGAKNRKSKSYSGTQSTSGTSSTSGSPTSTYGTPTGSVASLLSLALVPTTVQESSPSRSEVAVGNLTDLPGMISSIMEGCKQGIFEDVAKNVNEMEERVKEKLEGEKKDVKDKFKGQEVNWKRKLEQLEEKHLNEKETLEKKVTALEVANMELVKKRKLEDRKSLKDMKEMEEKIKKLEATREPLKSFFCKILKEEVDMDSLEDKMPQVLEKIREINYSAEKINEIKKIIIREDLGNQTD